jgi:hypothetical protein
MVNFPCIASTTVVCVFLQISAVARYIPLKVSTFPGLILFPPLRAPTGPQLLPTALTTSAQPSPRRCQPLTCVSRGTRLRFVHCIKTAVSASLRCQGIDGAFTYAQRYSGAVQRCADRRCPSGGIWGCAGRGAEVLSALFCLRLKAYIKKHLAGNESTHLCV